MAYFSPRPDGLVDADVGGRTLPMAEDHARAAGLLPAPMPDLPSGNPYSMANSPDAVAGPGGGPSPFAIKLQSGSELPSLPVPGQGGVPFGAAPSSRFGLHVQPMVGNSLPTAFTQQQPAGIAQLAERQSKSKELADIEAMSPAKRQQYYAHQDVKDGLAPDDRGGKGSGAVEGLVPIRPSSPEDQRPPGIAQGPGRIVQTSKGGDIRASFTRRPGEELDPSLKKYTDELDPEKVRSDYETSATNAAIARDNAVANDMSATAQAMGEIEAQKAQVAQNRANLQKRLDVIDQREREANAATPQTAKEVIGSRPAIANILSGLSVALGGFERGVNHSSTNVGMQMLDQSIESEISSQRAKWEAAKDKVGAARTDFGKAMELYGDPNSAEADMRMRSYMLAAKMTDAFNRQGANTEQLQAAQQTAQQLQAKAAEQKQALHTLANGQVTQENYVYKPPTFAQVGGPPKLNKDQREAAIDARKRQVRLPGGAFGYVVNEAHTRAIQDKVTAADVSLDDFNQIRALLPKDGGPVTDLNTRKKIAALQDRAITHLSAAEGQGVVTKADAERASQTLADPNAIITNGAAALDATEGVVRNSLHSIIRDNIYADPDNTTPVSAGSSTTFKPGL